jgi:hypothetical protein
MCRRLALFILLGLVSACNAPQQNTVAVQPKAPAKVAPAPSKERIADLTEQCGKKAREEFGRGWKEDTKKVEFASHYNAKLNTCFYLLTVSHPTGTLGRSLFDMNGGEQYGEYLGPAVDESPATKQPASCRVEGIYCASRREWEVLVGPFMED